MSSSQTPGRDSCGGIPVVWAQVARGPRPHTLLSMLLQPLLRFFDFKCYLFAGLLFSLVSLTERTPIASPKIPSSTVAASNFKSRNMIPNTSDFVRLSSVYVSSFCESTLVIGVHNLVHVLQKTQSSKYTEQENHYNQMKATRP